MAMSVFLSMQITIDESQLLHFCRMTAAVFFPEISLPCHPLEKTEFMMLFYAASEWSQFISTFWFVFRHFSCFLCLHFRLLRRQEPFFRQAVNSPLHTDIPAHLWLCQDPRTGNNRNTVNPHLAHIHILFIHIALP